jgi:uncharacterized membrane protein
VAETERETTQTAAPPAPDAAIHAMEALVSRVLEIGVVLSLALLVVGSVLLFARDDSGYGQSLHDTPALTRPPQRGVPAAFPHSVWAVFVGAVHGRPYAVIGLGLLVLIATPVVRVAATLVGFVRAKDAPYIAITAIVLAVLLLSFALGKAG